MSHKRNDNAKKKPWWMFGAVGLYLLSKGKAILPLLKFGKLGGAIVTMIASVGAYMLIAPFEMALGIVAMIFIHELGHVWAAKQKGLPVSAPVFIPFLGAFIAMKKHPRDAATEAYMALGGPVLGTVGAMIAFAIGWHWDIPILIAIANLGFFINLINLLPIHPLDGGRIATAVTRWLWLLGLVGGIVVIFYMRSYLFFIIWAMFAWDLYKQYVKYKGAGRPATYIARVELPVEEIIGCGGLIPGEEHKRELVFHTYSSLEGVQTVEVFWESIGLTDRIQLPLQGIVKRVHVQKIVHEPKMIVNKVIVHYIVEYETYINDRYYEVPVMIRWKFGVAYVLLAAFLLYMILIVKDILAPLVT